MKFPNYEMLRLMIVECKIINEKYPDGDTMPLGAICPGYDRGLMQSLATLKYIYGIKTQWSCQGNHKEYLSNAYILLPPDNYFPEELTDLIESSGLHYIFVEDYDENQKLTDRKRAKITANLKTKDVPLDVIEKNNAKFLEVINEWSKQKIIEQIPLMKKASSSRYNDLISIYK